MIVRKRCADRTQPYLVHKLLSFFALDHPDIRDLLVVEKHTVELIRSHQHLWSERRGNELCTTGKGMDHRSHCRSILGVQVGVNLQGRY